MGGQSVASTGGEVPTMDAAQRLPTMGTSFRHNHVPRHVDSSAKEEIAPPTTLMIRNLPNRYTQRQLISELEDLGFAGTFDFLYLPLDKGTMSNVGYAFVNFVEHAHAERCM